MEGTPCTGVAHCGQTVESSGMEAPHLKQNIGTSLAFQVARGTATQPFQVGKYFIAIEKTITVRWREPLSLVTGVCPLPKPFKGRFRGKVSAHAVYTRRRRRGRRAEKNTFQRGSIEAGCRTKKELAQHCRAAANVPAYKIRIVPLQLRRPHC